MLTFEKYFATSAEMMLICDRAGKIIKVNDKWEEKLGYSSAELVGNYFIDFVHPEDVPPTLQKFNENLNLNLDSGFINRYLHKNDSFIYLEWDTHILPDFVVAQAKDVTERERLKKLHELNEERLRLIFDNSKNVVALVRARDRVIVECNTMTEKIMGFSREQLVGKKISSSRFLGTQITWEYLIDEVFKEGFLKNHELKIITPELGERIFLFTGSLIEYDLEPHIMFSANDVTDLRQKENALLASEKRLSDLFENMVEGFAVYKVTDDGKDIVITQANKAFNSQVGFPSDLEVVGKTWRELFPTGRFDMHQQYIDVAKTGVPITYEAFSSQLRKWYQGKVFSPETGYVAILFEDITARKEEHELLLKQKAELEKTALEKDKVFSMLVHDLRSPFHGLINLTAICKEEFDNLTRDEIKIMINQVSSTVMGVYSQMNELLEWILLQRGMMEFRKSEVDLYKTAVRISDFLNGSLEGKRLHLTIKGNPGLIVMGDQRNIESIFSNLMSNAIKFTPKGGDIKIGFEENESSITVSIADSGIGIPAKMIDTIFNSDSSLKRRGTDGEATSGLGLLLCKELLNLHGGSFWLESTEGVGTTFYFSLPRS